MKKVLLLGDSIRMGYEPYVRKSLDGLTQVCASPDNGRFAEYTLWGVNLWMREFGAPDIVHWNNGIWDVHHEAPMVEALTPLREYLEILARIIQELKRAHVLIIFATTTPVPDDAVGRSNAEIDLYNAEAVRLMEAHHIAVNDLNAVIRTDKEQYISGDGLHLNEAGYQLCAKKVVKKIKEYL